jgi:protein-disulfide isomerase
MAKKYWIILGVVLLLLIAGGGAWYFMGTGSSDDALAATVAGGLPADKVQPDDHVMGSANAPVTMVEYFAQACSVCAHFDQDVFPQLKAKYIDTGKVRYVMRLFPLFPVDGPAYKLDTCVPKEKFFQAADLLFRNQPQWDSGEFPGADAQGGLMRMAHILGLSDQQAQACMNSTAQDAHINQVANDGNTRYTIQGTPSFAIDFKKVDFQQNSWNEVQAALDAALKAKGAN